MSYLSNIVVFAIVLYLRDRHVKRTQGRSRDATLVNLNVLLGALVALFLGQIFFDVFGP